jgi:hypothetical protein
MASIIRVQMPDGTGKSISDHNLKQFLVRNPGAMVAPAVTVTPPSVPAPKAKYINSKLPKKKKVAPAVAKKGNGQSDKDGGSESADQSSPA